ncbi:hypothetical protein, partial [Anaerobutyricum hallii]|uniref:hypothetical protein n=1 Tax=Anaerobutyricum hallii TaxID=39488 RepID=UPI001FAA8554
IKVIPVTRDRGVVFPQRGESLVKKPRSTSVARRCITSKTTANTKRKKFNTKRCCFSNGTITADGI